MNVVAMHERMVDLRRLRERTARLAMMQAGARTAAARALVDDMQQHIDAEVSRLHADIRRFDDQADAVAHVGRWFTNGRDHFDQRRIEIERLRIELADLEAEWMACREELNTRRQQMAAAQGRREQMQKLARRIAMRERLRAESRRESAMAELLADRARRLERGIRRGRPEQYGPDDRQGAPAGRRPSFSDLPPSLSFSR